MNITELVNSGATMKEIKLAVIVEVLAQEGGNQSKAAKRLGMNRGAFRNSMPASMKKERR